MYMHCKLTGTNLHLYINVLERQGKFSLRRKIEGLK